MGFVVWEVVGGGDKGGLIVRNGKDMGSDQEADRLATGAFVEELELDGERLHYKVLKGKGPEEGWVSVKLKTKELLAKTDAAKAFQKSENKAREDRAKAGPGGCPDGNWFWEASTKRWDIQKKERDARLEQEEPEPGLDEAPEGFFSRHSMQRVANFRDGAGPPGREYACLGGKVRRGMVFRTGQWNSAKIPDDLDRIKGEFGIKTYIDLRSQEFELGRAPCFDEENYPPCPSGRHRDMPERKPGERRRLACPFTKDMGMRPFKPEEKLGTVPKEDRKAITQWWYQAMQRDKNYKESFNWGPGIQLCVMVRYVLLVNNDEVLKAMKAFAQKESYPIAYGCMAGKDRTGLLGCLVLSALGVSEEDIMTDYLATNRSSGHIAATVQICISMWHDEIEKSDSKKYEQMIQTGWIDKDRTRSKADLYEEQVSVASDPKNLAESRVYAQIMYFTFEVLREEGGVLKYLESIGFGPDDVERMREILVEPGD